MSISSVISRLFDDQLPFRVEAFDGSVVEPTTISPANEITLKVLSPHALIRVLRRPGELGLARAFVAGDLELEGDLDALFALTVPPLSHLFAPSTIGPLLRLIGSDALRPLAPPAIEARQRGALHSRNRDRAAISHHYDVSNRFYEMVLGPSMTYSCAVFAGEDDSLEVAQRRKVDLICRKLDLQPGQRLLDVGCGWGAMAIHAAQHYGVSVVGITLSVQQQAYATARARELGVGDRCEFRLQDYRDVRDGPYDAISSIGMSEHVGRRALAPYASQMFALLRPGGRFLNHAIGRPVSMKDDPQPTRRGEAWRQTQIAWGLRGPSRVRSDFIERYVFPDGELHDLGTMVALFEAHGLEVRHVEGLREHYARTLRFWVDNLVKRFDEAADEVGVERARVWRLYMAGSAVNFERHHLEIHQVLTVKPVGGRTGLPWRLDFEPDF
ncbi:MAG: class I SAM-dependent methyltransferase [Acidobacteriota bacterium]|nr:class I SAM-dependent methyltransferase [Acidobacteriota bacterium]MDE3092531.1 class I SAM-dependent methyltransferase [Acidobacteriota bacterium]MDE3138364.1 class I SAM-dependent methyltransferase [Acidobacteriota bacterium]MDE3147705.1 class I SAM-dependent methyltransferase [Acidobacteriota bacterium]